jgi:hypothetical protein
MASSLPLRHRMALHLCMLVASGILRCTEPVADTVVHCLEESSLFHSFPPVLLSATAQLQSSFAERTVGFKGAVSSSDASHNTNSSSKGLAAGNVDLASFSNKRSEKSMKLFSMLFVYLSEWKEGELQDPARVSLVSLLLDAHFEFCVVPVGSLLQLECHDPAHVYFHWKTVIVPSLPINWAELSNPQVNLSFFGRQMLRYHQNMLLKGSKFARAKRDISSATITCRGVRREIGKDDAFFIDSRRWQQWGSETIKLAWSETEFIAWSFLASPACLKAGAIPCDGADETDCEKEKVRHRRKTGLETVSAVASDENSIVDNTNVSLYDDAQLREEVDSVKAEDMQGWGARQVSEFILLLITSGMFITVVCLFVST